MLRILTALWLLGCLQAAGAETLTLEAGWTPVAFSGTQLTTFSMSGPVSALAWYDGQTFQLGRPDLATVNELGPRRAFYLFAQGPATLTYETVDDGRPATLHEGWNLVSFPRGRLSSRENLLPQAYPADGRPPLDLESLTFEAGRAYWIYARTPGTAQFAADGPLGLPVTLEDSASVAYTVVPFGCHLADHGTDGHPGWDLEFRPGASVRSAGDGTVQTVLSSQGRFVVQVLHGNQLRTVYTNVESPVVTVGQTVTRGQPLGQAGSQTMTIGSQPVTFQMCHFQVDDFRQNHGLTNVNAVNPEGYLTAEARVLFDQLWARATYGPELTEPFPGNSRDATFPMTRRWVSDSGTLEFTRTNGVGSDYTWSFQGQTGRVTRLQGREIELSGRRGTFDIVSNTLRLDLGDGPVTYRTSAEAR